MPWHKVISEETPQTHLRSLRGKVFRPQVFRQILPLLLGIVWLRRFIFKRRTINRRSDLLPPMDQLLDLQRMRSTVMFLK